MAGQDPEPCDEWRIVPLYNIPEHGIVETVIYADSAEEAKGKWFEKHPHGVYASILRIERAI